RPRSVRAARSSAPRVGQQLGARVGAVEGLRQLRGRLLLLLGQLLGHLDLEPVADVALAAALCLWRALAAEALDRAVPGARLDLDLLCALQRRHLDRRPAQRLGDRDRHRHLEVAGVEAFEDRRGGDAGDDEEIAGRATALSCLTLAGEANPRPVFDPGGNIHLVALGLLGQAGAVAGGAWVLDHLAGAPALRAGLADREEALALSVD